MKDDFVFAYVTVCLSPTGGNQAPLEHTLSLEKFIEFGSDPKKVLSARYGLPWERIFEWNLMDGRIRCSGKTKGGRRCRHTVPGLVYDNPREWNENDIAGGYCASHGSS